VPTTGIGSWWPVDPFLGVVVLDIVYVLAVIAVFAVVSLVAKGVEKL
jgi:hypothetical protein